MDLTLGVKSGTVGRKLGGGWDLGSTFVGGREGQGGGTWTSGQHLGVWVNTLLTCLSSHTCHFSTKFQPKFVFILKQIKIRSFGDITSATETSSVLLQTQRQLVCCYYVQIACRKDPFFWIVQKVFYAKNYTAKIAPFPAGWLCWSH